MQEAKREKRNGRLRPPPPHPVSTSGETGVLPPSRETSPVQGHLYHRHRVAGHRHRQHCMKCPRCRGQGVICHACRLLFPDRQYLRPRVLRHPYQRHRVAGHRCCQHHLEGY